MVVDKKKSLMLAIIVIVLFLIIALLTLFPRDAAVAGKAVFTNDVSSGDIVKEKIILDNNDVFYYDVVYSASAEKYTLNFYSDVADLEALTTINLGEGEFSDITLKTNKVNLVIKNSKLAIKTGLDIGLVAHWDFDSGSLKDSVSGVVATNNGAVTASGYDGKGAYSFDGVNGYINTPEFSLNLNQMSFSTWVKYINNPSIGIDNIILSFSDSTKNDEEWIIYNNAKQAGSYCFYGSNFGGVSCSTSKLQQGVWTHLAGTYDGTDLVLYFNGVAVGTFTVTNPGVQTKSLFIGSRYTGTLSKYFNGKIDEVRIYDRALSAGEVDMLANPSKICIFGLNICDANDPTKFKSCSFDGSKYLDGTCKIGTQCLAGACLSLNVCGDGILGVDEQCDDGNVVGSDGCSADCGTVEQGYECLISGDACSLLCGNGVLDAPEVCDDNNKDAGDGCSVSCLAEAGFDCTSGVCEPIAATCGNGVLDAGEVCDDSNALSGDGCSADCTIQDPTYTCTLGYPCIKNCGNGIFDIGETCDYALPGNLGSLGCSVSCEVVEGYTCSPQTGICLENEICFDKIDNDLDSLIDCKDSDCSSELNCLDDDSDGFINSEDNCPALSNAAQTDTDSDGVGDDCEPVACVQTTGTVMGNGCAIGDVDETGCVDDNDLNLLNSVFSSNFDKCSLTVASGDMDNDGCVNAADLKLLQSDFVSNYLICSVK